MQNRDKIKALSETQPSQFRSVPLCKQGSVGFKPEPETVVLQDDSPQKKRPKTPANDTLNPQCSTTLKELMKHPTLVHVQHPAADAAGFSTNSNKAGRATMLKSRFADTISRAQQKMKVLKDDPMKMKQEKQILEKRAQLQDKEKTEAANAELKEQRERAINPDLTTSSTVVADSAMLAQDTIKTVVVNSAKNVSPMKIHNEKKRYLERRQLEENAKTSGSSSAATKMKAKIELKKKREAARVALENMENTAGIQLNLEAQKEFEILIGSSSSWKPIASSRFPSSNT